MKLYLIILSTVLSLIIAAIFMLLYARTGTAMVERAREQAATYVDLINHTKDWNLEHDGVYVEKTKGVESNVYLRSLGIAPDVNAEHGKSLTLRNHAIMVKEISRKSEMHDGIKFRIVSEKPLDPDNTPDAFENVALATFGHGTGEYFRLIRAPSWTAWGRNTSGPAGLMNRSRSSWSTSTISRLSMISLDTPSATSS